MRPRRRSLNAFKIPKILLSKLLTPPRLRARILLLQSKRSRAQFPASPAPLEDRFLAARNKTSTPRVPRVNGQSQADKNVCPTDSDVSAIATAFLKTTKEFIDERLDHFLPGKVESPGILHEAMR